MQQLIADTYEEAIMKFAKPKKPHDPNKKKKPPREIVKYLRIKKKASKELTKRTLTQELREKFSEQFQAVKEVSGPSTRERSKPKKRRPGRG